MSRLVRAAEALGVGLRGRTVLDLGPGDGADLAEAAERGASPSFVEGESGLGEYGAAGGVYGDFYQYDVLAEVLPVDVVWAHASVAVSLWYPGRVAWVQALQRGAREAIMIVPHYSYVGEQRTPGLPDIGGDLERLGFTRHALEGVTTEPMCPYLFLWRRA